ncbi:NYN domain-containing protein [Selenomonas ruminantium]|uniref:NYN domain-containing protein n=1 Tax=Selenomonas ruminantium TaxID=971 RepID=A0A1M6WIU2_SELRU|nr:NYN domain-containing protein [Selenomonas ruminantium]SHK93713.1 NYN domain-containing protein [Selenomonas ruminantium]
MTLVSNNEVVAILYDIENAPFEMLNFTLSKARRYQPCRTIVVSDWEARPEQKRWERLLRRPGFTFRQISRTYQGKNSLDSAIYDSAKLLYDEGVRRFFIITTDSDFVKIAEYLNSDTPSYIIGVGTKQASEALRNAYDEFFVYPPEEKKTTRKKSVAKEIAEPRAVTEKKPRAKKTVKAVSDETAEKAMKEVTAPKSAKTAKTTKAAKTVKKVKEASLEEGILMVNLPRTLRQALTERQAAEGVSMDELVTYLLMRGIARWVED